MRFVRFALLAALLLAVLSLSCCDGEGPDGLAVDDDDETVELDDDSSNLCIEDNQCAEGQVYIWLSGQCGMSFLPEVPSPPFLHQFIRGGQGFECTDPLKYVLIEPFVHDITVSVSGLNEEDVFMVRRYADRNVDSFTDQMMDPVHGECTFGVAEGAAAIVFFTGNFVVAEGGRE